MKLPPTIEQEIKALEMEMETLIKQKVGPIHLRGLRAAIEEFMHMVGYSGKS